MFLHYFYWLSNTIPEPLFQKDTLEEEEEISTIVANRRREQMSVAVGGPNRVRFSIWASFAEVYNEQVYDLLVPPPEDAMKSRRFRTANGSKPSSAYHQSRPTAYQRSTRMKRSSPPHFGRRERVSLPLKEDVQGRPYISGESDFVNSVTFQNVFCGCQESFVKLIKINSVFHTKYHQQ